MNIFSAREAQILSLIRTAGPLSRRELHSRLQLRPNSVGDLVATMIEKGLVRQADSIGNESRGRPRQPLEIDPARRRVLGLAFEPRRVSVCQLSLLGERVGETQERTAREPGQLVTAACELLKTINLRNTIAIGASVTGFVDTQTGSILTSSATMHRSATRLDCLYAVAGSCPVLLENDMHALAAYWQLHQASSVLDDVLLIDLRDGAVGAALLVAGRLNQGCIIGGNELGHARFPVETDVCYCGQQGCLECIFSSKYLARLSGEPRAKLLDRLVDFQPTDAALEQITRYLSAAIANAINFIRPNCVVITGAVGKNLPYGNFLVSRTRSLLLAPLAERVRIDLWDPPSVSSAEVAGWLVLSRIFRGSAFASSS